VTPRYWQQACRELSRKDRIMCSLIRRFEGLKLRRRSSAFVALSRAIVGQQISVKAAHSVWMKFAQSVEGITPENVARLHPAQLARCGLSRQKCLYIRDLAAHFLNASLNPRRWTRKDDETVIEELTDVRGIGRWTAEMFLIFYLLRPNVLPLDDIGLQRAVSRYYNDEKPLSKTQIAKLAQNWLPWRSVATWYLWRSLEPVPIEY
jgi:DNA-3-methyladenine glycosylase II